VRRTALAAAVFIAVSVPWIAAISTDQGRVTFGDAGRITYLRYVNGIPYPYWNGEMAGLGSPAHAPRLVLQDPPVHEFGSPIAGTNPLSFDPAYWYEGAVMQFRPEQQAGAVLRGILYYYDLFIRDLGGTFACILLLYIIAARGRQAAVPDLRRLTLLLPAAAALALYGLVYVEGRYVGVFALLIFLDALANLRLPLATPRRLVTMSCALMIAFVASGLAIFHLRGSVALQTNPVAAGATAATPASPRAVAESLRQLGIEPGDAVGVIGYAFDSFWARAAGVRLVAELQQSDVGSFWAGDDEIEARVLDAFSATGARAVVAEHVPSHVVPTGWHRIGNSSSYVRSLSMPKTA
jgi:hypothetical protein